MRPLLNARTLFVVFLVIGLSVKGFQCQEDAEEGGSGSDEPEEDNQDVVPDVKNQKKEMPMSDKGGDTMARFSDAEDTVQEDDDNGESNDDKETEINEDSEKDTESNEDNETNDETSDKETEMEEIKDDIVVNDPITTARPAVYQSSRSRLLSIISKPGIMAGIVGGVVIGILTAALLIMFIIYRMRKKDEGSYALEETKKPLNAYDYRHCPTKEFYA